MLGDGDTVHTDFAIRDQTLRLGTTVGQTTFQQRNVKTNNLSGITVSQWFSNNRYELFVRKYGIPGTITPLTSRPLSAAATWRSMRHATRRRW